MKGSLVNLILWDCHMTVFSYPLLKEVFFSEGEKRGSESMVYYVLPPEAQNKFWKLVFRCRKGTSSIVEYGIRT